MERELRIVIVIFLIFFVYGLTSFFSLGDFVTPFFLGKMIMVIVSFMFFIINIKLKKSIYLFFAFLAMLSLALADEFTIIFLSERIKTDKLLKFADSNLIIWISFVIYYTFFLVSIFLLKTKEKTLLTPILLTFSLALSMFLFFVQLFVYQTIVFDLFLILYVIKANQIQLQEKTVISVLSAEFLLFTTFDLFKSFI